MVLWGGVPVDEGQWRKDVFYIKVKRGGGGGEF